MEAQAPESAVIICARRKPEEGGFPCLPAIQDDDGIRVGNPEVMAALEHFQDCPRATTVHVWKLEYTLRSHSNYVLSLAIALTPPH